MKHVPPDLKSAILRGRCIAFVGAGFAMPVVPTWGALLQRIGEGLDSPVTLPAQPTAFQFEAIGQGLQDEARKRAPDEWKKRVRAALDEAAAASDQRPGLAARSKWLRSIPFKAILTTNFDSSLSGAATNLETYWNVLRNEVSPGWQLQDGLDTEFGEPPIIKLHGDVDQAGAELVFSRADYRQLIYGDGNYANFVRAVFAGYTLLFLGVSFTDAYLNELRSEVLNLLHRQGREGVPWGYAIQINTSPQLVEFFEKHESIRTLPAKDPAEFDEWLESIARATSVEGRLSTLLEGKTIVWVDASRENNVRGRALFERCGATVHHLLSENALDDSHAKADLLITQFGHDAGGRHRALGVLDKVSGWRDRPPVIVFAAAGSPDEVRANRSVCLRHGAFEYATQWNELYAFIESLLDRTPGRSNS